MTLKEVQGSVEVRHRDSKWEPASAGGLLHASDAVRTGEGSYAVLTNGEVEVRMEPSTEVSVEKLSHKLSRFQLGNGMTTASVQPDSGHVVEVKATGSDAEARTESGTFTMSNDGQGTVSLGTREGEVTLLGQGQVVIVRAGQQSLVRPGHAPTEPAPVPSSLLLKVNWPARPTLAQRKLVITGQTDPGTRVEVAGRVISADKEGRFSHTVPLREGRNAVAVRARSVGGLSQEEQRELTVDTTPPEMGLDPELWK
jgi:hypothetical protein